MNTLLLCFLPAMVSFGETTDEIPAVELKAVAQRTAIHTMAIDYRVVSRHTLPERNRVMQSRMWVNGDQFRHDWVEETNAGQGLAGLRRIACRNCEKPGWGIDAYDAERMSVILAPLDHRNLNGGVPLAVRDPRLFGYLTQSYSVTSLERLDKLVASGGRTGFRTSTDQVDGVECIRVDSERPNDQHFSIWIAPSLRHTVMRVRHEGWPNSDDAVAFTVSSEGVKPVGNSGLYYPTRIVWEQLGKKGKVIDRHELDVKSVSINEPLPPGTFTVGGLGLPDGTHVSQPGITGSGYLEGGVLVSATRSKFAPASGSDEPPVAVTPEGVPVSSVGWVWAVAAGVLTLFAVAVAVYRVRTSRDQ